MTEMLRLCAEHRDGLAIEIGSGGGEHIIWQALLYPERFFIACEAHPRGVLRLLRLLVDCGVSNLRIYVGDGLDVLAAVPSGSVGFLYTLFPDPWHKKRHHKRRLIGRSSVRVFHSALAADGFWRFASDSASYVAEAEACLRGSFTCLARRCGTAGFPDWPSTRYENKARQARRQVFFLLWQPTRL